MIQNITFLLRLVAFPTSEKKKEEEEEEEEEEKIKFNNSCYQ